MLKNLLSAPPASWDLGDPTPGGSNIAHDTHARRRRPMAWLTARRSGLALAVVAAAGLAVAGWVLLRNPRPDPTPSSSLPFQECATEAGLDWRMTFLTNESGENFKINLYDHGSGLAVGDFDGDGLDDIYFC